MDLEIDLVPLENRKEKPKNEDDLGFGDIFTDHMFMMDYKEGQGWHNPRITAFQDIHLSPAAMSIHYAQSIFEGLKCYRRKDGGVQLFRPRDNFERFNRSAVRLCMPELDVDFALKSLKEFTRIESDWVPRIQGSSLYVRPTMMATEPHLGVRPASEYLYFVILAPVGAYYKEGFNPITILVSNEYTRAVRGGVGDVKAAGNYAASLYAAREAQQKGFTQILWLDAVERKYIEEVGTSNIFFLFENELVTPPLAGSILGGITRLTVLDLARKWGGREVVERPITIDEVMTKAKSGELKEVFSSGTAVVISPVGEISYDGVTARIGDGKTGPLAYKLFEEITAIQYGTKNDTHGWIEEI
ncbi:MAG: branched-chain amino acid aminotransferase [Deltaproteobacteria bacterium]|nr:branched-chain amino acid aminotransferase [Deltaproteobacteria bacterium]